VRGLVTPVLAAPHGRLERPAMHSASASLVPAAFHYSSNGTDRPALLLAAFAEPAALPAQHGGGGGGGGGGGHGGGGTGGGGTGGGGGGTGGGGKGGGGNWRRWHWRRQIRRRHDWWCSQQRPI